MRTKGCGNMVELDQVKLDLKTMQQNVEELGDSL